MIVIKKQLSYEDFENIIVTALEGGSNYWYNLDVDSFKGIDLEEFEPLAIQIAKGLYNNKESEIVITDIESEEDEVLGIVTYDSVRQVFEHFPKNFQWALDQILNGDYDACSADVIFQIIVMGDVVYG